MVVMATLCHCDIIWGYIFLIYLIVIGKNVLKETPAFTQEIQHFTVRIIVLPYFESNIIIKHNKPVMIQYWLTGKPIGYVLANGDIIYYTL